METNRVSRWFPHRLTSCRIWAVRAGQIPRQRVKIKFATHTLPRSSLPRTDLPSWSTTRNSSGKTLNTGGGVRTHIPMRVPATQSGTPADTRNSRRKNKRRGTLTRKALFDKSSCCPIRRAEPVNQNHGRGNRRFHAMAPKIAGRYTSDANRRRRAADGCSGFRAK